MSLRMGDGPPANLPAGLDAYAGYVDQSGIGATWPSVLQLPAKYHLSITVHGGAPAMCGDVESGALASWRGYTVGYCAVSRVNELVRYLGRPRKLWTAHYTDIPHLCSPVCWPGLVTTADATQWTTHGGVWDESLCANDFFDFLDPAPEDDHVFIMIRNTANLAISTFNGVTRTYIGHPATAANLQAAGVKLVDFDPADYAAIPVAPGAPSGP